MTVSFMKQKCNFTDPERIRFENIIDMAAGFSSMIRLFRKGSKEAIRIRITNITAKKLFNAISKNQYIDIHSEFCDWGSNNIFLAEKKRDGKIITNCSLASFGQIAKVLDVALKVAIYYSHLPDCEKSKQISHWLNAAVDTQMMKMLSKKYPNTIEQWPTTIKEVDRNSYMKIQETVRIFIKEVHNDKILPVQFDDIYWRKLNR